MIVDNIKIVVFNFLFCAVLESIFLSKRLEILFNKKGAIGKIIANKTTINL